MKYIVCYEDYTEFDQFEGIWDERMKEFDSIEKANGWIEENRNNSSIRDIFGPLIPFQSQDTIKPKTASEFLRFQNNGIWDQIRALNDIIGTISQQISRCSDAVYQYEKTLRFIANNSTDPVAKANAQSALDDHLVN